MADRRLRARKKTNYTKMNVYGRQGSDNEESDLEEGQLVDTSPFQVEPSDGEFPPASEGATSTTLTEAAYLNIGVEEDGTELHYEDDVGDDRRVVSEHGGSDHGTDGENDVASDEVWNKQQQLIKQGREKREQIKRRLEREKQLAEEKLVAEKEKEELQRMEREI